eukprot:6051650-Lingulodinium_polyedra.AAC.1
MWDHVQAKAWAHCARPSTCYGAMLSLNPADSTYSKAGAWEHAKRAEPQVVENDRVDGHLDL